MAPAIQLVASLVLCGCPCYSTTIDPTNNTPDDITKLTDHHTPGHQVGRERRARGPGRRKGRARSRLFFRSIHQEDDAIRNISSHFGAYIYITTDKSKSRPTPKIQLPRPAHHFGWAGGLAGGGPEQLEHAQALREEAFTYTSCSKLVRFSERDPAINITTSPGLRPEGEVRRVERSEAGRLDGGGVAVVDVPHPEADGGGAEHLGAVPGRPVAVVEERRAQRAPARLHGGAGRTDLLLLVVVVVVVAAVAA